MIKDERLKLKQLFLDYFRDVPLQNLACDYIGVHEDTITNWKKEDSEFSDQILNLKAEWARKNVKSVRSKEWLLERIMRKEFAPPQQKTDITSGGKPLPILGGITHVPANNSNNEAITTQEKN